MTREVELFIVIDPERPSGRGNRPGPADLWSEKAGGHTGEHHERGKSVEVRNAHAARVSWNLGAVPFNREGDGCSAQHAEIVGIVCVLPDVLTGKDKVLPESLLQPRVEFIAPAQD